MRARQLFISTIIFPIFRPLHCSSKILISCLKRLRVFFPERFFHRDKTIQQFLNIIKKRHVYQSAISATNKSNVFRFSLSTEQGGRLELVKCGKKGT